MVTPDSIKRNIEEKLACELVHVEGDGHHFEAVTGESQRGCDRCPRNNP